MVNTEISPESAPSRCEIELESLPNSTSGTNEVDSPFTLCEDDECKKKKERLEKRKESIQKGRKKAKELSDEAARLREEGSEDEAGELEKRAKTIEDASNRLERDNIAVEDARLCESVYEEKGAPLGWDRLEDSYDSETGFGAAVYRSQIDGRIVLVFRGSDRALNDWWENNLQQGLGYEAPQYKQAREMAEQISKRYEDVTITGHSLGGGLAANASMYTGISANTFNAAGVHKNTYKNSGKTINDANSLITNFHNSDILTNLQEKGKPIRNIVELGATLGRFVNPVNYAKAVINTKLPNFKRIRIPKALGKSVKLPINKVSAKDRHGIKYVIESLEKEKKKDEKMIEKET